MLAENLGNYGDAIADLYDEWYGRILDHRPIIDWIRSHTPSGASVLELGVGTGRVAIPVAQAGYETFGIDASSRMLERLGCKPGGEAVATIHADMSNFAISKRFELIYCPFNTFPQLTDVAAQIECVKTAHAHTTDTGKLVIENEFPDLARFTNNQVAHVWEVSSGRAIVELSELDIVNQRIRSQYVVLSASGTRLLPEELRYVWPSELALYAKLAGFSDIRFYSTWDEQRLTNESRWYVAVLAK